MNANNAAQSTDADALARNVEAEIRRRRRYLWPVLIALTPILGGPLFVWTDPLAYRLKMAGVGLAIFALIAIPGRAWLMRRQEAELRAIRGNEALELLVRDRMQKEKKGLLVMLAAVGCGLLLAFVSGTGLLRHQQRVFVFEALFGLLVLFLFARLVLWLRGEKRDVPAPSWAVQQQDKRD